ncbi:alpha/beta fold hydrolase [Pedobacter jeongneungensis]|uniref:alpha/beta fold hydrolase n=1 Tax=Pedobacter jeongneungensis TaxID=947309 RepID=UPI000469A820|nr:alpha/beta hydrolase [Pedobacter jeongneungensis]
MKEFVFLALRTLKYLGFFLVVLILIGIVYEQYCRWNLEAKVFKNKTFAEINGASIHYQKKGNGNKTVVLVSGMGSNSTIWAEVQDKISAQAVTISYDRSGLFLSGRRKEVITNESVSSELEELLEKTKCPKPYLLVVHSMAGIYVRLFIARHKKDIAGIIFMESAHPLQLKKSSKAFLEALKPPPLWFVRLLTATGIYRTLFFFKQLNPEIPVTHPIHQNERDFFYRSVETLFSEIKSDEVNFDEATRYGDFENIPLTIISGSSEIRTKTLKNDQLKGEYMSLVKVLHRDFLNLSSRSKLVVAKQSGHIVQASEPDLIVHQIRELLQSEK